MKEKKVANLVVAGVSKCGTTSLFSYLASHPDVCGSNVKETQFFMPLKFGRELPSLTEYEKFFTECGDEKYRLDATPYYLFGGKKIAQAIHDNLGEVKIVFIFREPVARAFSWYQQCLYNLMIPQEISFRELITEAERKISADKNAWDNYTRVLQEGFYFESLQQWFEILKTENVKVLFFEDLKKNSRGVLDELCAWLKIDSSLIPDEVLKPENKTGDFRFKWFRGIFMWARKNQKKILLTNKTMKRILKNFEQRINKTSRKEKMSEEEKKYLQNIFKTHNENLKKLLLDKGYSNFPDWLK